MSIGILDGNNTRGAGSGLRTLPALLLAGLAMLLLLALLPSSATAQPGRKGRGANPRMLPPDSVRIGYHFKQGQSVHYRVLSQDSVLIYDSLQHTLVRERTEMVRITCDTVIDAGYVLTMTTTGYSGVERFDDVPAVTRVEHPWVGRPITFVMSKVGKRIALIDAPDDPAGTAPGAPFQPLLLPYIGDDSTFVGASGNFDEDQWMFDNIYPPVMSHGGMLKIVSRRLDTLKRKAIELQISNTSRLTFAPEMAGQKNTVKAIVNGGGLFYMVPKLGYPLGGRYGSVTNFTIESPGGKSVSGRQFITMSYGIAEEER